MLVSHEQAGFACILTLGCVCLCSGSHLGPWVLSQDKNSGFQKVPIPETELRPAAFSKELKPGLQQLFFSFFFPVAWGTKMKNLTYLCSVYKEEGH